MRVRHRPSDDDVDVDPQEYFVSAAWVPVDHWHDQPAEASFSQVFFFAQSPAPTGPWKYIHFSGSKQQVFVEYLGQQVQQHINANIKSSGGKNEEYAKNVAATVKAERNTEKLKKARVVAKEGHEKAKALRQATVAKPKAQAKATVAPAFEL